MSEPLYNVVFYGIIQPGKDRETVVQNMASLFKTEPAKLAPYFAGGRKVIKSNINELAAEKYRAALENVGLVIKIEAAAASEEKPQVTTSPSSGKTEQVDTGSITLAEVGADMLEHPVEVTPQPLGDISDITLAEVGADVLENPVEVTPQPLADISDITMAEVGADVLENPVEVTPQPLADISDMTMAEVGADVLEHPVEITPQPLGDINDITLAEVGTDIIEHPKEKEKTPEADTSGLSLK